MSGARKTERQGKPAAPDPVAIETEIERIQGLKPEEARSLWEATFKRSVPKALTKDLLVRTICWDIQERAFGGHSPAMLRLLASYAKGRHVEADRLRRLKPGTEVVREYQGERHTVVITAEGFAWRGLTYPSLSAIARAITGSNWNGPRFFGLREEKDGKAATKIGKASDSQVVAGNAEAPKRAPKPDQETQGPKGSPDGGWAGRSRPAVRRQPGRAIHG